MKNYYTVSVYSSDKKVCYKMKVQAKSTTDAILSFFSGWNFAKNIDRLSCIMEVEKI